MKPRILTCLTGIALLLTMPVVAAPTGDKKFIPPEKTSTNSVSLEYESNQWQPIWSDEFNYEGAPDPAKWKYEVGMVRNTECQFYTLDRRENARVENGMLVITARVERWQQRADYTSASLTTRGKFDFTYGKVEIRARVPAGRGTWPALWTLGTNISQVNWPKCGEIDIMEFVGYLPDKFHFSAHTQAFNHKLGTHKTLAFDSPAASADFHRFGIIWTPQTISWFLDGKKVFEFPNDGQGDAHWPFYQPQYLLINLAIGGKWGGVKGIAPDIFPAKFAIDYVRVWQQK